MRSLKNIRGKKEKPLRSNEEFWDWFQENARFFHNAVKKGTHIERDFFDILSPKLNELREGYWFLAGMEDESTAELVLTVDGIIKNIVFVEELIASAPKIEGWIFTALKPAINVNDVSIRMGNLEFTTDNLFFYSNDSPLYPDEIDITVVYETYDESNQEEVTNAVYVFIDNYLGELKAATAIDNMQIIGKNQAEKELIPIDKLNDFLLWREKEFVEKYEGTRYNTESDNYSSLEGVLDNTFPIIAIVNATLLNWDSKASHPWMLRIEIKFNGQENGLPDDDVYDAMEEMEESLMRTLKDADGYLNLGRQTGDNTRETFFACKDFRLPAKVMDKFQADYADKFAIAFEIYKDKYWLTLDHLKPDII